MQFGRVPPETVELFQQTTQQVQSRIMTALPGTAGEDVKKYTLEQLLDIVYRDWVENGNNSGLEDADIRDLASFVQMAVALAGSNLNGTGLPIYQATLRGLLEDWLQNWNAPGDPGPPGPIN